MTERKALQTVLTSLYCTNPSLTCGGCPVYKKDVECTQAITNDEFKEAVLVLEEKLKNMEE